jgi:hypothetical protein
MFPPFCKFPLKIAAGVFLHRGSRFPATRVDRFVEQQSQILFMATLSKAREIRLLHVYWLKEELPVQFVIVFLTFLSFHTSAKLLTSKKPCDVITSNFVIGSLEIWVQKVSTLTEQSSYFQRTYILIWILCFYKVGKMLWGENSIQNTKRFLKRIPGSDCRNN